MPRTAAQIALHARRLAERICTSCGADLKPLLAWTRTVCPECAEAAARRDADYKASRAGVRRRRLAANARYQRRAAARLCVDNCGREAVAGLRRCEPCLANRREWNARYEDRKEATCG